VVTRLQLADIPSVGGLVQRVSRKIPLVLMNVSGLKMRRLVVIWGIVGVKEFERCKTMPWEKRN
jgi:hypothetical protein